MATLTEQEAKILVFLKNTDRQLHNLYALTAKLDLNYVSIQRLCEVMCFKGWLTKIKSERKAFYEVTLEAPIDKAIETLSLITTQNV